LCFSSFITRRRNVNVLIFAGKRGKRNRHGHEMRVRRLFLVHREFILFTSTPDSSTHHTALSHTLYPSPPFPSSQQIIHPRHSYACSIISMVPCIHSSIPCKYSTSLSPYHACMHHPPYLARYHEKRNHKLCSFRCMFWRKGRHLVALFDEVIG